ncbi:MULTISPECIES: hypothetical protein [unclassified Marinobacterium]|uniref:hypothetical protein n=1 Tax=unclassified Marinobacterium TaxID=2644139 RepID=UPI00156A3D2D|nr:MULTISPECIES: hypothetical protein [unclassified Marinobacterium]NRP09937.1 hypothetical protein [Marinobacterium sp. xm-g-48]NRP82781.1 hypothetical protein [Marinobacterium sp. xm-d-509]
MEAIIDIFGTVFALLIDAVQHYAALAFSLFSQLFGTIFGAIYAFTVFCAVALMVVLPIIVLFSMPSDIAKGRLSGSFAKLFWAELICFLWISPMVFDLT